MSLTKRVVATVPDDEKMGKRAGKLLEEFKDLVFPADYTPGVKRKVVLNHSQSDSSGLSNVLCIVSSIVHQFWYDTH